MEGLDEIVRLGTKAGHLFVATADPDGLPHIALAHKLAITPAGQLRVTEWFCPGTNRNLEHNRRLALVVWDGATDTGYQVLGEVEEIHDRSMLDGFAPAEEKLPPVPQVERELILRVDEILDFRQAAHTDEPIRRQAVS
jgi:hypothetical protein